MVQIKKLKLFNKINKKRLEDDDIFTIHRCQNMFLLTKLEKNKTANYKTKVQGIGTKTANHIVVACRRQQLLGPPFSLHLVIRGTMIKSSLFRHYFCHHLCKVIIMIIVIRLCTETKYLNTSYVTCLKINICSLPFFTSCTYD